MLKALDEMIDISKCHSTGKRYATIRNWFLDNYPAVKEFGMPKAEEGDNQNQVVPFTAATNQAKSA
jgi:hypothetical protein